MVIKKPVTLHIDQSGNHKTKVVVFTITTLKKLNQMNQSNSYLGGKGQHFSLARWLLSHFLITLFQDHIESNGITDEHVSKLREVIMKMNYSSSKSNNFGLSSFSKNTCNGSLSGIISVNSSAGTPGPPCGHAPPINVHPRGGPLPEA